MWYKVFSHHVIFFILREAYWPFCCFEGVLPSGVPPLAGESLGLSTLFFLLIGLREGALGREGKEGLTGVGPGTCSSITWTQQFRTLEMYHKCKSPIHSSNNISHVYDMYHVITFVDAISIKIQVSCGFINICWMSTFVDFSTCIEQKTIKRPLKFLVQCIYTSLHLVYRYMYI